MAEQTMRLGLQATKPRTDTDEYRRQVVDMVTSTGRTAMSVAAELGIPAHFLWNSLTTP